MRRRILQAMGAGLVAFSAAAPLAAAAGPADTPDFAREIAPILSRSCATCHRAGGCGPFALDSAATLRRKRATAIAVLEDRLMPPWLAQGESLPMRGGESLPEKDRDTLLRWLRAGAPGEGAVPKAASEPAAGAAPQGAPNAAPAGAPAAAPLTIVDGWRTGIEPTDFMRSFAVPLPAAAAAPARFSAVTATFAEPGVVHRVLLNCDTTGAARRIDDADAGPGCARMGDFDGLPSGSLGALGVDGALRLPRGFALVAPRGADLVAEVHADGRGRGADAGLALTFEAADPSARPLIPIAAGIANSIRLERQGAGVTLVTPPITAPVDLVGIIARPGDRCVSFSLRVIAAGDPGSKPLLEMPRYLPHLDRTWWLATPLALGMSARFELRAVYEDETVALRAQPMVILLAATPIAPATHGSTAPAGAPSSQRPATAALLPLATVPAGRFTMGDASLSATTPAHAVTIAAPFLIATGETPDSLVTRTLGRECTSLGLTWFDAVACCNEMSAIEGLPPAYAISAIERDTQGSIRCAVVAPLGGPGYRLPSEAEWEWAATRAAELGLTDMTGGRWEWCEDAYVRGYEGAPADGSARRDAPTGRSLRGGSSADGEAARTRTYRDGLAPSVAMPQIWFRAVRSGG